MIQSEIAIREMQAILDWFGLTEHAKVLGWVLSPEASEQSIPDQPNPYPPILKETLLALKLARHAISLSAKGEAADLVDQLDATVARVDQFLADPQQVARDCDLSGIDRINKRLVERGENPKQRALTILDELPEVERILGFCGKVALADVLVKFAELEQVEREGRSNA